MLLVNVKAFVIVWETVKQISKILKVAFVELSNLRGKFSLRTNLDTWFTYCILS